MGTDTGIPQGQERCQLIPRQGFARQTTPLVRASKGVGAIRLMLACKEPT
ncbi:MAG: hypothetical protein F6K50_06300 [Moorea sp. SIO3I7]|nr:hypothetical protein [Moorena sp. SIO3I7]